MKDRKIVSCIAAITFIFVLPLESFAENSEPVIIPQGHKFRLSRQAAQLRFITLTQTACQFLESEGMNYNFATVKKADCVAINKRTEEERLSKAEPLKLSPGSYIFRVKNENVPYQLGFYLRSAKLIDRLRLPKVSGGGLYMGVEKDYRVNLIPGEYIYSCPLNPTPDYTLIVE